MEVGYVKHEVSIKIISHKIPVHRRKLCKKIEEKVMYKDKHKRKVYKCKLFQELENLHHLHFNGGFLVILLASFPPPH